ncbi:MMPL family transporter [Nonomuraea mesophila]|nr:MMPL family transporter [Nonomuraea mesophila]
MSYFTGIPTRSRRSRHVHPGHSSTSAHVHPPGAARTTLVRPAVTLTHSGRSGAARWSEEWYAAHDVVVLYRHPSVKVRDPRYRKAVHDSLRRLPAEHVSGLATYWTTGSASMVSGDGHATYALVTLRDGAELERYAAIADRLRNVENLYVGVGGPVPLLAERNAQAAADLARAAAVAAPVLLALLCLISGSLVAAAVPVLAGLAAVAGTIGLLRLLTEAAEVSFTTLYAAAVLAFGLAAGYSAFVVRAVTDTLDDEASGERTAGASGGEGARERALGRAGRVVALSGAAVAVALLGLMLFPGASLRVFGLVGAAVALLATGVALVVPAAVQGVAGPRVLPGPRWRPRPYLAHLVATVVVLAALAVPYVQAELSGVGHRALPAESESRRVAEIVGRGFPGNPLEAVDVHVLVERSFAGESRRPGPLGQGHTPISAVTRVAASDVRSFTGRLERLPHVTGVTVAGLSQKHGAVRLSVHHVLDPMSAAVGELVAAIRSVDPGPKVREVVVGGAAAARTDLLDACARALPWAAPLVCALYCAILAAARLLPSPRLSAPRAPVSPRSGSPAPVSPASVSPASVSPASVSPASVSLAPMSPEPASPAPASPSSPSSRVSPAPPMSSPSAVAPASAAAPERGDRVGPVTVHGRPAIFGADTDPVPLAQEERELAEKRSPSRTAGPRRRPSSARTAPAARRVRPPRDPAPAARGRSPCTAWPRSPRRLQGPSKLRDGQARFLPAAGTFRASLLSPA